MYNSNYINDPDYIETMQIKQKDWEYLTSGNPSEGHSEAAIRAVMQFNYNREEAINILDGLNPDGTPFEPSFY